MKFGNVGSALVGFAILTLVYVGALILIDRRNHVFEHIIDLATILPAVALFAFVSFALRYWRWRWLLGRQGFDVHWKQGFLAYLSGFALTASPGKLGELMRVRYFGSMGVPPDQVIACFIFERLLDLIAVLLLLMLLVGTVPGIPVAFTFVVAVTALVLVVLRCAGVWARLARYLQNAQWPNLAGFFLMIGQGLKAALRFFRPAELGICLSIGLAAWTMQSLGCVYLIGKLDILVPWLIAFSLYPLALLVGAASMSPGGLGSTEAAMIVVLNQFGVPFDRATIAAIGIRLSTLWFAIVLGVVAILVLEFVNRRPETNIKFGHGPQPLRNLFDAGREREVFVANIAGENRNNDAH
jgi:uncharacterized membrane protein YbhN (UPF0104 family)